VLVGRVNALHSPPGGYLCRWWSRFALPIAIVLVEQWAAPR
jgi:hypothetical protein